jgi:hypothetical protein
MPPVHLGFVDGRSLACLLEQRPVFQDGVRQPSGEHCGRLFRVLCRRLTCAT